MPYLGISLIKKTYFATMKKRHPDFSEPWVPPEILFKVFLSVFRKDVLAVPVF